MINLRDLLIGIGFKFDDSSLQSANDATDSFVSSLEVGNTYASEIGETFTESSELIITGMDDSTAAADTAADSLKSVGDTATDVGDEGSSAFGEFASSIEEIGVVATGAAALLGTAFSYNLYSAGSALEAARQRIAWYTSDSEEDFEALHGAVSKTVVELRGLYAEGELLEATARALKLGTDPQIIADNMTEMGILAAKHGESLSDVMLQVGRAVETGSVRGLEEMGIVTEETFAAMGKEMERSIMSWDRYEREQLIAIAMQDVMNENMDEFGDFMETNEGQMQRMKSEIGNVMEIMSDPILTPMATGLEYFARFLQFMQANPIGNELLQLGGVATIIVTLLVSLAGLIALGMKVYKVFATVAALFGSEGALAGVIPAISAVIGALTLEIVALVAIVGALIFIFQDVYTYLKGGDSLIGRFEQRLGNLGKVIVRSIFPIIGAVEAFRELYSVLQELYTMATELGISGILAEIGITTESSTGVPGTTGINTGEAPVTGVAAVSSRMEGIKNNFDSSVTVSVSGSNASAEEIGAQVETAMNRSFDTMMDKHMKKMGAVS